MSFIAKYVHRRKDIKKINKKKGQCCPTNEMHIKGYENKYSGCNHLGYAIYYGQKRVKITLHHSIVNTTI